MGWQPIETAPRDGTDLLLWLGVPVVASWQVDRDGRGAWFDAYNFRYEIEGAWLWMPLPAPPSEAAPPTVIGQRKGWAGNMVRAVAQIDGWVFVMPERGGRPFSIAYPAWVELQEPA